MIRQSSHTTDIVEQSGQKNERVLIGCDLSSESAIQAKHVLQAVLGCSYKQFELHLMEQRFRENQFCAWNFVEEHGLVGRVKHIPYYRNNPSELGLDQFDVWIDKHTDPSLLTSAHLDAAIRQCDKERTSIIGDGKQHVLLFTAFHPYKKEGNSVYTQQFLGFLREQGFVVHLVYYDYQKDSVTDEMRAAAVNDYIHYHEIPVSSKLVGHNLNGLNVHVDDWCGTEAVEYVDALCRRFDFAACFVNYAFFSGVFEAISKRTLKILLCHDKFADRNRRMIEQGYPHSGWMSISESGERMGCLRADLLVAIQEHEGAYFRELVENRRKVVVVPPLFKKNYAIRSSVSERLRVGYFGSKNFVNETNLAELIGYVNNDTAKAEQVEFIVAGGTSEDLGDFLNERDKSMSNIRCLGRVEDLRDFFQQCDIVINPDRGGTGMKLKTVEAIAHGMPVVCTTAGAAGLDSPNRFHAAANIEAAAELVKELIGNPVQVDSLKTTSCQLYDDLYSECNGRMNRVLEPLNQRKLFPPPLDFSAKESVDNSKPAKVVVDESESKQPTPIVTSPDDLISVIVPFYGVEEFIGECLESTINQTYSNLEIILVDDCSPDGSRKVAEEFCRRDSRVRMLTHQKNQGLGPARNTAVPDANGKYIFFLDSDDLLLPYALEALHWKATSENAKIVVGSSQELLPDGSITEYDRRFDHGDESILGWRDGIDAFQGSFQHPNSKYIPVRAWGTLIERQAYVDANLAYPPVEHEDLAVTPFLYHSIGSVLYIPDKCVYYRYRESSLSRHGWDAGRINRQSKLWKLITQNCQRYGLEKYISPTAITFCGHLVWKIENYGCKVEDLDCVFDVVNELVMDMESDPDFEHHRINWMIETMKRIVCRYDGSIGRDRFNRITSSFGANVMAEHYQAMLN